MAKTIKITDKTEPNQYIRAEKFRPDLRKTKPHKHKQYFEIVYLLKGSGSHTIDYDQYEIKPPVVFLIRQEQVHHWDIRSKPEGFVLIIKKEFFDQSLDSELKKLLTRISGFTCLYLKNIKTIEKLFELITTERQFVVIEGLLKALMAKIEEQARDSGGIELSNSATDLFQSFCKLLGQENELQNSVSFYAKKLNVTPQNLSMACQKFANRSAGEILSEYIIQEAKRLLLYTDKSVSEIGYQLNFNDPSHFVKYFKRHSGYTPKAFRTN